MAGSLRPLLRILRSAASHSYTTGLSLCSGTGSNDCSKACRRGSCPRADQGSPAAVSPAAMQPQWPTQSAKAVVTWSPVGACILKPGAMSWRAAVAPFASQATPPGAGHMKLVPTCAHMLQVSLRTYSCACQLHVFSTVTPFLCCRHMLGALVTCCRGCTATVVLQLTLASADLPNFPFFLGPAAWPSALQLIPWPQLRSYCDAFALMPWQACMPRQCDPAE